MIFSQFASLFKSKSLKLEEIAYLEGFSKGFELGLAMASDVDAAVKNKIRQEAIEAALARLHGNNSQAH